jgi:acyl-CoA thioesterase-2
VPEPTQPVAPLAKPTMSPEQLAAAGAGIDGLEGIATAANGQEALEAVLTVLDVQPDPDAGEDYFSGTSYRPPWQRIFGGQVLAQSLVAATKTVSPQRQVHSMHAYFLRPGDPALPISFGVERLRDGRSFSARRTQALQNGKPILSMIASFQEPATGLEHQSQMPDVPGPEELPNLDQQLDATDIPVLRQLLRSRPVELRHVGGSIFLVPGPEKVADQSVWMRASAKMPDDPLVHTALMAFASDYNILEGCLRPHGLSWSMPGIRSASLDHAIWFHRPVRMDEWLLYTQESPSASGARGLGMGRIYRSDGVLVASVAQEGMIRLPRE